MMTSSCEHNFPDFPFYNSDSNARAPLEQSKWGIGGFVDADGLEGACCPRANPRILIPFTSTAAFYGATVDDD